MKVMNTCRTAGEKSVQMERAYVDAETGKTLCCWDAKTREQIVNLFQQAGVVIETIASVTEVLEMDLK